MTAEPVYYSWDPGGSTTARTTGLTRWDAQANVIDMRSLTQEEFDRELENLPESVKLFIIEEYKPFGHINHTGNKLLTSQRIGDIKGFARRRKIKIIEQPSKILTIAAMWAQYKWPRNKQGKKQHLPDYISSFLHGYYYLFNQGLIKPKVLEDGPTRP